MIYFINYSSSCNLYSCSSSLLLWITLWIRYSSPVTYDVCHPCCSCDLPHGLAILLRWLTLCDTSAVLTHLVSHFSCSCDLANWWATNLVHVTRLTSHLSWTFDSPLVRLLLLWLTLWLSSDLLCELSISHLIFTLLSTLMALVIYLKSHHSCSCDLHYELSNLLFSRPNLWTSLHVPAFCIMCQPFFLCNLPPDLPSHWSFLVLWYTL